MFNAFLSENRVVCERMLKNHGTARQTTVDNIICRTYRVAHEKPARRLVEQLGRRSRTLYRKLNKCKCREFTG